ncbi:hypothetical protein ACFSKT_00050 [Paenibacillus xanthanilyticus]|uniref:hypothetical protein n=1 Tax=Paenibacillus xanthanilyticus TaxID=1783531 RepID=UPI003638B0A4
MHRAYRGSRCWRRLTRRTIRTRRAPVAGGLPALIYGAASIPSHWVAGLARLATISNALCRSFEAGRVTETPTAGQAD